jgi:hypothetical protein
VASIKVTLVPLYNVLNDVDPYVLESGLGDPTPHPEIAASNIDHTPDAALTSKPYHEVAIRS